VDDERVLAHELLGRFAEVQIDIEPCCTGSPKTPTMSSVPSAWNSSSRAEWAAKCSGARSSTSGAAW
jgi:hypothetical protein